MREEKSGCMPENWREYERAGKSREGGINMGIYVYACEHCSATLDDGKIRNWTDKVACPKCGRQMRHSPTAPARTPAQWK